MIWQRRRGIMKNKVILVRKVDDAQALANQLHKVNQSFATVEAEYGDVCVEGSWQTLAHHTEYYREYPAPCIRKDVRPLVDGVILISHLDLDTLGGIMLLEGIDEMTDSFWESEALIDTRGVLAEADLSDRDCFLMRAYWAWETNLPDQKYLANHQNLILDVTDSVELRISFIQMMLKPYYTNEEQDLLNQYYESFQKDLDSFLSTCVYEDEQLRVFISQKNQHFLSHVRDNQLIETCITLNQQKGTLTLSDISGHLDCKEIMQDVFGENAGGQFRVAGSPRDETMDIEDLNRLIQYLSLKKGWPLSDAFNF